MLRSQIKDTLATLPMTLDETYPRLLRHITPQNKPYAVRILQLLLYSGRPVRLDQVIDAIIITPKKQPCFDAGLRMPHPEEITRLCPSLISLMPAGSKSEGETRHLLLQLAHASVREYLQSQSLEMSFRPALSEIAARKDLMNICIAYIVHAFKYTSDMRSNEDWAVAHSLFPLLEYCASYWMLNADFAAATDTETQEEVKLSFNLAYEILKSYFRVSLVYGGSSE